jgi:Amt family ammonium transporter
MENLTVDNVKSYVDTLWVFSCAILVFIMQAGFMCMESGLSRHKNSINVALKNLADFSISIVIFWLFGFGLMFGKSFNGFFGTDLFFFETDISAYQTYFVFQAMFVATASTIISGAVAERLKFVGYLLITTFSTGIIYPIVGHWAWSSGFLGEAMNKGWLVAQGFVDFAGSSIVHSVGGWIALAGIITLGPRVGRFSKENKDRFTGSSFPLAVLGTLILWFGWFGFNGGSNGALDDSVALILINTFLAASFGLLTGLLISFIFHKKPDPMYLVLGPLAGLVSITASCNSVNSFLAIMIGIIGSIIAIIASELLEKYEIDDVVGAVPVHLAAGIWGTLAVGLFSDLEILGTGLTRLGQIKVQSIGIVTIGAFSFTTSMIFFKLLNLVYPLRVSPLHEQLGLNIAEHGAVSVEHDLINILSKQSETGDLKIRGPQNPFTTAGVIGLYYNKLMNKLETSEEEKNKWRKRILHEINLAVNVQKNFLPKRNLENYPVQGINFPAREISGDFFSFYPHNNSIYFIIADVAGKGVHAGMVMAKTSTLFDLLSQDKIDLDEMMLHINNDLFITKTGGMFVTSILGTYDLNTDEVLWVNGGHQPAVIRDSKGNFEETFSDAPPLGVIKQKNKSIYKINKKKLNGSRFYVFTDGLSESLNEKNEEIGIEGSKLIINNNYNKDLKIQLYNIAKEVINKTKDKKLIDDLTIVAIGK